MIVAVESLVLVGTAFFLAATLGGGWVNGLLLLAVSAFSAARCWSVVYKKKQPNQQWWE